MCPSMWIREVRALMCALTGRRKHRPCAQHFANMLEVPTSQDLGQAASGDHAQQKAAAVARKSSLSSGHKRARTS